MQPAIRHGSQLVLRSLPRSAQRTISSTTTKQQQLALLRQPSWICIQCRIQQRLDQRWEASKRLRTSFSTSPIRSEDQKKSQNDPEADADPLLADEQKLASSTARTGAAAASLPSHQQGQRWHMSKRMEKLMDDMLLKASLASQQINTYTGTDYSGIEALRQGITDQERHVRECHHTVQEARRGQADALSSQTGAQKEIVGLLERKSGWSPADLERYMSLVRSEHLNDQAMQNAKERVQTAERDLESARALLEKLERKQYHEEQIWSDTIRRNSTWVTIGLMGVNIILLLAQLVIFEPYRRRKIVREVKTALDEKDFSGAVVNSAVVKAADAAIPPSVVPGLVETQTQAQDQRVTDQVADSLREGVGAPSEALMSDDELPDGIKEVSQDGVRASIGSLEKPVHTEMWHQVVQSFRDNLADLFSQRSVELKKVDITTIALESAAAGIAAMSVVMWMLKPR